LDGVARGNEERWGGQVSIEEEQEKITEDFAGSSEDD
jgi:hypothetical protein